MPDTDIAFFRELQSWLIAKSGGLHRASVSPNLNSRTLLAPSRAGLFKLESDHSEPDFSYLSWFAMRFSAGSSAWLLRS